MTRRRTELRWECVVYRAVDEHLTPRVQNASIQKCDRFDRIRIDVVIPSPVGDSCSYSGDVVFDSQTLAEVLFEHCPVSLGWRVHRASDGSLFASNDGHDDIVAVEA